MCLSAILDILTASLLLATLVVLIVYTVATWSLRNQAIKQTKISQRPFVTIYDSALSGIKYKNSGLGIALNIEIMPLEYQEYTVTFSKETVLGSKEESILSIDPKFENKQARLFLDQQSLLLLPN